jgi:ATP-dependent RNA circularization protein (DNA/RNA ligase family)
MPSRDYLIRQFEEMGFFLASVLRRILKMKEENQQEQMESAVREELIQELKLDIDQLIMLENEEFLSLVKTYFTSEDQLEKLADILKVLGQDIEISFSLNKANYLKKAIFLFNNLQENSSVFSYDRRVKILEIQEILIRLGLTDN